MAYKLFSAPWCPHCTPVKNYIIEHNIPIEIVDVDVIGRETAKSLGVKQLPSLQILDGSFLVESQEIMKFIKGSF